LKKAFTITPSPNVDAPIINEYKLTLECNVVTITMLGTGNALVTSAAAFLCPTIWKESLCKFQPNP